MTPIRGEVRGFQTRSEPYGNQTITVWTFRIERVDPEGNRLPPVPVQMRSRYFDGFINEGDQVELKDKWKEGHIVEPKELYNLSTNSIVKKKRRWL
jgi:hypothetical protein